MAELSVAMLAHNEAKNIRPALESVRWADQIVLVDADSSDDTGKIGREFGATVIRQPNRENLNVNKNIAIEACQSPWVLVLDADEVISDALAGEIRRVIAAGEAEGFLIPRRNFVLGRWARHGSQYPDWQLRLFRKESGRFGEKHVHERLKVNGRVTYLSEPMDHYPYPDVDSMIQKGRFYAAFEAGLLIRSGRKIGWSGLMWNGFVKPFGRYCRRYFLKGGFLDGTPGLIVACFDFWNTSLRWMMVWEHWRKPRGLK